MPNCKCSHLMVAPSISPCSQNSKRVTLLWRYWPSGWLTLIRMMRTLVCCIACVIHQRPQHCSSQSASTQTPPNRGNEHQDSGRRCRLGPSRIRGTGAADPRQPRPGPSEHPPGRRKFHHLPGRHDPRQRPAVPARQPHPRLDLRPAARANQESDQDPEAHRLAFFTRPKSAPRNLRAIVSACSERSVR
jgi:hypothetical protein